MVEMVTKLARTSFNDASGNRMSDKNVVRGIVQSVSRGNINLQLGNYITEKDKDLLRENMMNYEIKGINQKSP